MYNCPNKEFPNESFVCYETAIFPHMGKILGKRPSIGMNGESFLGNYPGMTNVMRLHEKKYRYLMITPVLA